MLYSCIYELEYHKKASGSGYYKCSMFLLENVLCYIYYMLYIVLSSSCWDEGVFQEVTYETLHDAGETPDEEIQAFCQMVGR